MTLSINANDLDPLKGQLLALVPQAQASHRAEALARGLGFGSNAALRAGVAAGPTECEIDNRAFVDFLASREVPDVPYDTLSEAVVRVKRSDLRAAIAAVMDREPELGSRGYRTWDGRLTVRENAETFRLSREEMLKAHSVEEFARAVAFLQTKEKARKVSRKGTSYGYKHEAERFHEAQFPRSNPYVANGLFIAAALHLDFTVKRDGNGPNGFINIASAPMPRDRSGLAGTLRGQKKRDAWRNMMVAGINAGLEQRRFGLSGDDGWDGEEIVYRFLFDGLPAIACVRDIGGELAVHVAIQPMARGEEFVRSYNAGFLAGEAFASGWLEREDGRWLQTSLSPTGSIRNALVDRVAHHRLEPLGYADNGRVM
ncbi:hypothetical protein [Brevundimonas bullata]|jgi:hypothetical protein|uniref:hypothetical protein n=1 Tax=Brevundimonas bullata TaxID=13160 RepID=UPI003D9A6C39